MAETKSKTKSTAAKASVKAKTTANKTTETSKVAVADKAEKTSVKASKPAKKTRTAVLEINNMQYVVSEGETILTRIKLDSTKNEDVTVNLLAIVDGDSIEYGKPYVSKKLNFELGSLVKGEKVHTMKYKSKARYRKRSGMRPKYIEFKLNSIEN